MADSHTFRSLSSFSKDGAALDYGAHEYWQSRYNRPEKMYEYYFSAETFIKLAAPMLAEAPPGPILEIGCGNSRLAEGLAAERETVAVDYATEAVRLRVADAAREDAPEHVRAKLTYAVADATNLPYEDGRFAAVVDKATFDAIDVQECAESTIGKCLAEAHRVLVEGGVFIVGTCRSQRDRAEAFLASRTPEGAPRWRAARFATVPKPPGDFTPDRTHVMCFVRV
jgi:SAM-dependent methyltransferase